LISPTSPPGCLLDDIDRGNLNLKQVNNNNNNNNNKEAPPKLLHPFLHRIPMHVRFGLNGFLSNLLFMVAYNEAVIEFESIFSSSTIYATVYLVFIPISHAIISLLVFGWPQRYIRSLMSNAPVGLTAILLGASLTAYLEKVEFNGWVDRLYKGSQEKSSTDIGGGGGSEFYSSIFVLLVTGIWTFVLSVVVNAPTESFEKKEL